MRTAIGQNLDLFSAPDDSVLDDLDLALAELVGASSDMMSERWKSAARDIKLAVAALFASDSATESKS